MPRELRFSFNDQPFSCELIKVDRSKLYGSVDIETRDAEGNPCTLATLANDGKTLIPNGGTAFGYLNRDGEWVERAELVSVDLNGDPVEPVPSSFDGCTALEQQANIETFLDHSIRLSYLLNCDDGFNADFLQQLKDGAIFQFDFSYRAGVSNDPAFILSDQTDNVWMLVGTPSKIDFTGLDQAALRVASPDADEEDDDDFNFDML